MQAPAAVSIRRDAAVFDLWHAMVQPGVKG